MTLLETAVEIHRFLMLCGEPYSSMDQYWLQVNVVDAVFTGHFMYEPDRYAVIYWMVHPEDVAKVERRENGLSRAGIRPGNVLYVAECGCKDSDGMAEMVRRARAIPHERIFWHRKGRIRHHGGIK